MVDPISIGKTEYSSIIDNYYLLNAWTDEESFPIKNASEAELKSINKICAIEYTFPGTNGDSNK
jgi:hypothetical protein